MASESYVTLSSGDRMPLMGFGTLMETLDPDPGRVVDIVEQALSTGYRHLDTAQVYNTESMVGQAVNNQIQKGSINRKEVFITTKLWRNAYPREMVVPSLKKSLERMGLDYVDLFLIHWPTDFKAGEEIFPKHGNGEFIYGSTDYIDTWKGMEDCVDQGLARNIGLSNFNSKQIQRILDQGRIKPANHQIESHPFLTNTQMVQFCQQRDISVTAYAPLAGFNPNKREEKSWPTVYSDEKLGKIAKAHGRTPAQVALRYQIERGVSVVPKSAKPERILENYQTLDFKLSADDMTVIEGLNQNMRLNEELMDHPHYPFNEPF